MLFSALAALLVPGIVLAAPADDVIAPILALPKAPPGVVFEVVEGDPEALRSTIPEVRRLAERLRARFPGLPIAVVTHGREQFALTRANDGSHRSLHDEVRRMTGRDAIEVQVCGTHAGWRGLGPEDFPDYVQVASSARSALRAYEEFGYRHLRLRPPARP